MTWRGQPPDTHMHLSREGGLSRCILQVRHAAWLNVGGVLQRSFPMNNFSLFHSRCTDAKEYQQRKKFTRDARHYV
ncbi:hypothetical protein ACLOJK_028269 [Asimina triloba]